MNADAEMMILEFFTELPKANRRAGRRTIYDFTKIPPGHRGGWPCKVEEWEDFEKAMYRKSKSVNGALGQFKRSPHYTQLNAENEYMLRTEKDAEKRVGMIWVYCMRKDASGSRSLEEAWAEKVFS